MPLLQLLRPLKTQNLKNTEGAYNLGARNAADELLGGLEGVPSLHYVIQNNHLGFLTKIVLLDFDNLLTVLASVIVPINLPRQVPSLSDGNEGHAELLREDRSLDEAATFEADYSIKVHHWQP